MFGKNNRTNELKGNMKEHYKAYKSGKNWIYASIASLAIGTGLLFGSTTAVHADTTDTNTATQTLTDSSSTSVSNSSASSIVLSASSSAETASSSADTTLVSSTSSETAGSTAVSSSTDTTTSGASESQVSEAVSSANFSSSTSQATSGSTTSTSTESQTLINPTSSELSEAKSSAASNYATTGTAQQINSVAADVSSQVTVGTTTKVYDGNADTPLNYTVTLSDGMNAPSGWYVTGTANQYYVSNSSGDLDLSAVQQNVGTYSVTLSAVGLAALQAANSKLTIDASDIIAGKLEITQAPTSSGTIVISGGSKVYDNNSATDPTEYTVTIGSNSGLVAPAGWANNGDGTYTVSAASGDIVGITGQSVGRYLLTLSASALQKLQAANPNYSINDATITSGVYQITSNIQTVIASKSINAGTSLNGTDVYVTVNNSANLTIPSDWTVVTDVADQTGVVYSVPVSYFDTSGVDTSTVGTYTITFLASTITELNGNDGELTADNIQNGTITVHAYTASDATFYPANMFTTISSSTTDTEDMNSQNSGGDNYYATGSSLQLDIRPLNNNAILDINNLTEYLIVPDGFLIGTTDENGNTIVADDAATAVYNQLTAGLASIGANYTGLTVEQEADYNGRQVFKISFKTVTTVNGSETLDETTPLTIVSDPNSTITSGFIGPDAQNNDSAVLYVTDNYADTQGQYTVNGYGAYVNIPQVAAALGIDNAYVLNNTYGNYIYPYTIASNVKVQDTYNFVDTDGNVIKTSVTSTGTPGDTYSTSSIVPQTITVDGVTYELVADSIANVATYPLISSALTSADEVAPGNTYNAVYKKVIDTTTLKATVENMTMTWTGSTPTSYTVSLPDGFVAPSTWTANADGSYTVPVSSGDLDVTDVNAAVGTYTVSFSAQGLADIAAANTGYLFDTSINVAGTLTISPVTITIPVTVTDTAGNTLKSGNIDIAYPDGESSTGYDASASDQGYPTKQIYQVIVNQSTANSDYNPTQTAKTVYQVDNVADTLTITTYDADGGVQGSYTVDESQMANMTPGDYLAYLLDNTQNSLINFGNTPTIDDSDEYSKLSYESIEVIYNQKMDVTVAYVDDDEGGKQVGSTGTITGFAGDDVTYTPVVPDNYSLVNSSDADGISYTITSGDTNEIVVHLEHQHATSTMTTTNTVNYTGLPESKTPDSETATVIWNVDTDKVTNISTYTPEDTTIMVASPEVTGYTPEQTSVDFNQATTTTAPIGQTATVNYTANKQSATVEYVDDDNGGEVVGKTAEINGVTDGTAEWNTDNLPAGYELSSGQAASGTYTFTEDDNQVIQIHVSHIHTIGTATTTNTVTYTGLPDDKTPAAGTVNVEWTTDKDEATGVTTYTPATTTSTIDSPIVAGYTADQESVDFDQTTTTTTPDGQTETVNYTANKQSAIVEYVDDDDNGKILTTTTTITGVTDGNAEWNTDNLPAGYKLVNEADANGIYTFTADANQVVKIHVAHIHESGTATTTNTVKYTGLPDDKTLSAGTADVNWVTDTDLATGVTTYTPVDTTTTISSPAVAGYTADQASVDFDQSTTTTAPTGQTATVNYTANAQSSTVEYVDDDNGGTVLSTTAQIDGVTDGTADWNTNNLPAGYKLANGQAANGTYQFTADANQVVQIHVAHIHTTGTATTTNTVHYTGLPEGKTPTDGTVHVEWATDTDEATGVTTYTPADATNTVDSPTVAGYTPSQSAVEFSQAASTSAPVDQSKTVNYDADSQTVTVKYVDDDNNGSLIDSYEINGVTDETVEWNTNGLPAGYKVATGQETNGSYTLTAGEGQTITVHLVHQHTIGQLTTTNTVSYTGLPESKTQPDQSADVEWTTDTDEVTGMTTYTPANTTTSIETPVVSGYTANESQVQFAQSTVNEQPNNQTATVNYTPDAQTINVTYIDDVTGQQVGTTQTLTGVTDESGTYNVVIPTNYVLANGQASTIDYTFTADGNANLVIHLNHHITDGTATTTRTINYVIADGDKTKTPSSVVQTMNWKTVTDDVTGESYATAQNVYDKVVSPDIAGYSADTDAVAMVVNGSMALSQLTDTTATVTYTADNQSITINYVDSVTGKIVKTVTINGKTDSTYIIPSIDGYTIDNNDATMIVEAGVSEISVKVTPINTGNNGDGSDSNDTTTSGNNGDSSKDTTTSNNDGDNSKTQTGNESSATNVGSKNGNTQNTTVINTDLNQESDGSSNSKNTNNTSNTQQKLPQTGDEKSQEIGLTAIGVLVGFLGIIGLKKRKRDED